MVIKLLRLQHSAACSINFIKFSQLSYGWKSCPYKRTPGISRNFSKELNYYSIIMQDFYIRKAHEKCNMLECFRIIFQTEFSNWIISSLRLLLTTTSHNFAKEFNEHSSLKCQVISKMLGKVVQIKNVNSTGESGITKTGPTQTMKTNQMAELKQ